MLRRLKESIFSDDSGQDLQGWRLIAAYGIVGFSVLGLVAVHVAEKLSARFLGSDWAKAEQAQRE